jgi:hypothetical protein
VNAAPLRKPPPGPASGFRLKTLLGLTAVMAVLAAIAGPVLRAQSPEAETHLLLYWFVVVVFAGASVWQRWRSMWRVSAEAGVVRFVAWSAPRPGQISQNVIGAVAAVAVLLFVIAMNSFQFIIMNDRAPLAAVAVTSLLRGGFDGFVIGCILVRFMKAPVSLCEGGIVERNRFISWHSIRYAEWVGGSPNVMMLCRIEIGVRRFREEIFIVVPTTDREMLEALVLTKTMIRRHPLSAHEKPPARAEGDSLEIQDFL